MTRAKLPWRFAPALALIAIGREPPTGQDPPQTAPAPATWSAPTSLFDPRLADLRRASVGWEHRPGLDRAVVDQVCLVPDLPTFLEVLATWDRGHAFPILFDDVESSTRFLRAFRPARVIRHPKGVAAIPRGDPWARAVAAVGSSWKAGSGAGPVLPGDAVPRSLGPTPPGVVLSAPGAPMLAGAAALAAGRFQPLLRLDSDRRSGDVLGPEEFRAFDRALTATVRGKIPLLDSLGDECDFLTLAGDWPYRHRDPKGELEAVDDGLGRSDESGRRWAFAGRLLGDPAQAAYRAMCSLFLQPDSALLFNGYDEASPPWSEYATRGPAIQLSGLLPTAQVAGDRRGGVDGWHETFDPENKAGLVWINSHGSPTVFHLRNEPAGVADIPRGVPSAVLMIHSFSAADPNDPGTVAGRWLANGAFAFFGSMNEPYLAAFRTPRLVGDLVAERIPIVAAVRSGPAEPFGKPWRLVYLGDPLYRLKAKGEVGPRLASWGPTAAWPAYAESPRPAGATDPDVLRWALRAAIARLASARAGTPSDELADALLGVRRDRLPAPDRPVYDALLVEVLLGAGRRGALRSRIAAIPAAERPPALRRCFETLVAGELGLTIARGDASKAQSAWSELIAADLPREFKEQATARVGRLADSPGRRRDWAELLRKALRDRPKAPEAESVAAELKRVEEADRPRPASR